MSISSIPKISSQAPSSHHEKTPSLRKTLISTACAALLLSLGGAIGQPHPQQQVNYGLVSPATNFVHLPNSTAIACPLQRQECPLLETSTSIPESKLIAELEEYIFNDQPEEVWIYIETLKDVNITPSFKVKAIQSMVENGWYRQAKFAIEKWEPRFTSKEVERLLNKMAVENRKLVNSILELWKPANPAALLGILKHNQCKTIEEKTLLRLISQHGQSLLNTKKMWDILPHNRLSVDFYKDLKKMGLEDKWFYEPNFSGVEVVQKFIRQGELDFLNSINSAVLPEGAQDCFLEESQQGSFTKAEIDPRSLVAQNGCRTVILEPNGRVLSLAGREAKKIFQEINGFKPKNPSFTVYFNDGHASIGFADGSHYGFYPDISGLQSLKGYEQIALHGGLKLGQVATGSYPQDVKSYLRLDGAFKAFAGHRWVSESLPCQVIDDSLQKEFSELNNQLKLDFYASETQVAAMKAYVKDIKESCNCGDEEYQTLTKNCIDFVQGAIQATGTKADFRDGFSREQLLNRKSSATLFSLLRSRGPEVRGGVPRSLKQEIMENMTPEVTLTAGSLALVASSMLKKGFYRGGYHLIRLSGKGVYALGKGLYKGVSLLRESCKISLPSVDLP